MSWRSELKEMIKDAIDEMARHNLHEFYVIRYGEFFDQPFKSWWVFVIKLNREYTISYYVLSKVEICNKSDSLCFHSLSGNFRLVGYHVDMPLTFFNNCLDDGVCTINNLD